MTAIAWQPIASSLSPREKQLLGQLLTGKSQRQAATDLFLAQSTVELYVSNIRAKLEDQGMELRLEYTIRRKNNG